MLRGENIDQHILSENTAYRRMFLCATNHLHYFDMMFINILNIYWIFLMGEKNGKLKHIMECWSRKDADLNTSIFVYGFKSSFWMVRFDPFECFFLVHEGFMETPIYCWFHNSVDSNPLVGIDGDFQWISLIWRGFSVDFNPLTVEFQ